jgi:hypothetical protein
MPTSTNPASAETRKFWPDDILNTIEHIDNTPAELLHAAAQDLNHRSGELVRAKVEEGSWGEHLVFDFILTSPALGEYSYQLFRLRHRLFPYPAEFLFDNQVIEAANQEELEQHLRAILADSITRRAVSELARYGRERLATAA